MQTETEPFFLERKPRILFEQMKLRLTLVSLVSASSQRGSACHSHYHLTALQHFYCLRTLPFFSELLPPSHGGHCHCHFKQGSCSQLTFNSSFKQFYSQLSIISSFTCSRYHNFTVNFTVNCPSFCPSFRPSHALDRTCTLLSWLIFSLNSAFHG